MTSKTIARIAGLTAGTLAGLALAGVVTSAPVAQPAVPTAEAATPASDSPACGYDVYRSKVYVTSLSKAHGTARVIKWSKPYRLDGTPRGIGTLVDSKPIKQGQTVTVKRPKHTKANRITVDIVKGELTRNESRRKVWHCDPA